MKNFRPDIITRPAFIAAILLLISNDFYFKYLFGGFVTGKLSDFAGLFVFPYFISSFRASWSKFVYAATAGLFAIWKSPLSEPLLIFFQSLNIGITRTVDYTDLFALIILPFSFLSFRRHLLSEQRFHPVATALISVVSMLAFWATSLARVPVPILLDSSKSYDLSITKRQLFERMSAGYSLTDSLAGNVHDSLFYVTYHIPDQRASVKVLTIITELQTNGVRVQLDSILQGYVTGRFLGGASKKEVSKFRTLGIADFENYFESEVIEVVRKGQARYVTYDNKLLEDSFRRNK